VGEVLHSSLLQLLLEHCDFFNIDISQGSVATRLRCGGIFKYELVANLPVSLRSKNLENRLAFGEVMGKSLVSCFFETQCIRNMFGFLPVLDIAVCRLRGFLRKYYNCFSWANVIMHATGALL